MRATTFLLFVADLRGLFGYTPPPPPICPLYDKKSKSKFYCENSSLLLRNAGYQNLIGRNEIISSSFSSTKSFS